MLESKNVKKYKKRLEEFCKIEDLQKFYSYGGVMFKSGEHTSAWFYYHEKTILESKDETSKKIMQQYAEYKKQEKLKQEQKKEESFQKRLLEFCEIEDLKKFASKDSLKFKDGAATYYWFKKNKKDIYRRKDETSKKIIQQYQEYLEEMELRRKLAPSRKEKSQELFEKRVQEFLEMDDIKKFNNADGLRFKDEALAAIWFSNNRNKILKRSDQSCEKIVEQYENYIKQKEQEREKKEKEIYQKKLIEFSCETSTSKFNKFSSISFKIDGASMTHWFYTYKEQILNGKETENLEIALQYQQYLFDIELNKTEQVAFEISIVTQKKKMLQEFLNISDMKKFEFDSEIRLSNGDSAGKWFAKNVRFISDSKDSVCIEITKQYEEVIRKRNLKNQCGFKKDELFFFKTPKKYKFNIDSNIILPSGISSGVWFKYNRSFIIHGKGPLEKEIKRQYLSYRDFSRLILEFYQVKDLSKFDYDSDFRFTTGALMSDWWEVRKDEILNDDFFLYVYIQNQYEQYCKNNGISYVKKSFQKK